MRCNLEMIFMHFKLNIFHDRIDFHLIAPTNSRSILMAPLCILFALSHSFSFHIGRRGVEWNTSFSSSQRCFKNFSAMSGSQCVFSGVIPVRSICNKSSTEACTAVPKLAAMPALRGSFCLLSQYILGHVS